MEGCDNSAEKEREEEEEEEWEGRVSHSFNHVQYVKTFSGWESDGGCLVSEPVWTSCAPAHDRPQPPGALCWCDLLLAKHRDLQGHIETGLHTRSWSIVWGTL